MWEVGVEREKSFTVRGPWRRGIWGQSEVGKRGRREAVTEICESHSSDRPLCQSTGKSRSSHKLGSTGWALHWHCHLHRPDTSGLASG